MINNLELFTVIEGNKQNIIMEILNNLQDDDMNGNNGSEYLWECSKKLNFKTNLEYMEYILNKSDFNEVGDLIGLFLKTLCQLDSFYKNYEFKTMWIDNTKKAVAIITECAD